MTGKNGWARRGRRIAVNCGLLAVLVLGSSFNGGAGRLGAAGGDAGAGMIPPPQGAAPLKPDWVEALLDARATALRSLLEARDLDRRRK
jgi:hypothetical protein